MERADFAEIFRIMAVLPVTIRLLDPPLHEFVPKIDSEFDEMARVTGKSVAEVRQRTLALYETNPMLGHLGCRLGITYPEIYETQAIAIFEAAAMHTLSQRAVSQSLPILEDARYRRSRRDGPCSQSGCKPHQGSLTGSPGPACQRFWT